MEIDVDLNQRAPFLSRSELLPELGEPMEIDVDLNQRAPFLSRIVWPILPHVGPCVYDQLAPTKLQDGRDETSQEDSTVDQPQIVDG
jgi:hypothetical protein